MKKKIFLAYAYSSKNAGDLAICIGALDLLIENGYSVTLLSKYDKLDPEFFSSREYYRRRYKSKITFLEAPFTLDRNASFIQKFINNLKGYIVLKGGKNKRAKEIGKYISQSDYVIFNGGNLLRCSNLVDYIRLKALYYPIQLAKKMRKPYLIFPQSTANIDGAGKRLLQKFISEADYVFLREEESYQKLKHTFGVDNLIQSIDLAYFIRKEQERQNSSSKTIAFTLRAHSIGDLNEFSREEKLKIYEIFKFFLEKSSYTDYKIVFVVQTRKDIAFTEEVVRKLQIDCPQYNISIFENYDPLELLNFYKDITILIGMRLHSIILASSIGVPCYGLFYKEWGLKNPGMMKHLDMPFTMIDEELNGQDEIDFEKVEFLMKNSNTISNTIIEKIHKEKNKMLRFLDEKIK